MKMFALEKVLHIFWLLLFSWNKITLGEVQHWLIFIYGIYFFTDIQYSLNLYKLIPWSCLPKHSAQKCKNNLCFLRTALQMQLQCWQMISTLQVSAMVWSLRQESLIMELVSHMSKLYFLHKGFYLNTARLCLAQK